MDISFPIPQVDSESGHSLGAYNGSERSLHDASPPPMPSHWRNNFSDLEIHGRKYGKYVGPPLQILFAALCLVSVGRNSLDQKWKDLNSEDKTYKAHMDRIIYRLTSITTMIGLLLASMAALVTTEAPKGKIIDYTMRGPYICLWASFGLLLGAAVVGSTGLFIMSTCTADWTINVLMSSRARLICLLITLAYPFLAVGISTVGCAFGTSAEKGRSTPDLTGVLTGLLAAAWSSQDDIAREGCVFLLLAPLSMGVLFVVCIRPTTNEAPSPGNETRPDQAIASNDSARDEAGGRIRDIWDVFRYVLHLDFVPLWIFVFCAFIALLGVTG
ncbi:hypothetical protein AURDEDRAFT_127606 [Auricularia subglabra TFB-10046 SS5]|nr:hypothetical protein AURDEDRAFT_127606 [Auricularia subglabra TFB-10046 SS5]